jgi:hypothetical protein
MSERLVNCSLRQHETAAALCYDHAGAGMKRRQRSRGKRTPAASLERCRKADTGETVAGAFAPVFYIERASIERCMLQPHVPGKYRR